MPRSTLPSRLEHSTSFVITVSELVLSTQSADSSPNMADPLSIAASSLTIAGQVFSGLKAVWELLKQIQNAPEDAQMFLRLLNQVTQDFEYAMALRSAVVLDRHHHHHHHRAGLKSIQDKWIYDVLIGTLEELDDFGKRINRYGDARNVDIKDKMRYVFKDAETLKLRKDSLAAAHTRLLAGITAMQLIASSTQSAGLGSPPPLIHHSVSDSTTVTSLRQRALRRTTQMPSASDDEKDVNDKKGAYSDDDQETLF